MTYARLLFIAVIAFGAYTLGARAGRSRYRHIKKNAQKFWSAPSVRSARKTTRRGTKQLVRSVGR